MLTYVILAGSVTLLASSLVILRETLRAQRDKSQREFDIFTRLPRDMAVHISAYHPISGRNLSMPAYPCERAIGSLRRMLDAGLIVIPAVENFDRGDPRHVQSLWGAMRTFELVIAERGGDRVDSLSLDGADVDDLIAQADYPALFRLAEECRLNDPLQTQGDAGATLAMPAFKVAA